MTKKHAKLPSMQRLKIKRYSFVSKTKTSNFIPYHQQMEGYNIINLPAPSSLAGLRLSTGDPRGDLLVGVFLPSADAGRPLSPEPSADLSADLSKGRSIRDLSFLPMLSSMFMYVLTASDSKPRRCSLVFWNISLEIH